MGSETAATPEYDPQQPLYPWMNARTLLESVLWDLAMQSCQDFPHFPHFPNEAETDRLAPSLKETVARTVHGNPEPPPLPPHGTPPLQPLHRRHQLPARGRAETAGPENSGRVHRPRTLEAGDDS